MRSYALADGLRSTKQGSAEKGACLARAAATMLNPPRPWLAHTARRPARGTATTKGGRQAGSVGRTGHASSTKHTAVRPAALRCQQPSRHLCCLARESPSPTATARRSRAVLRPATHQRQVRPPALLAEAPPLPVGYRLPLRLRHPLLALLAELEALEARERRHGLLARAPLRLEQLQGAGLHLEAVGVGTCVCVGRLFGACVLRRARVETSCTCAPRVVSRCHGGITPALLNNWLRQHTRSMPRPAAPPSSAAAHRFVLVKGPEGPALAGFLAVAPLVLACMRSGSTRQAKSHDVLAMQELRGPGPPCAACSCCARPPTRRNRSVQQARARSATAPTCATTTGALVWALVAAGANPRLHCRCIIAACVQKWHAGATMMKGLMSRWPTALSDSFYSYSRDPPAFCARLQSPGGSVKEQRTLGRRLPCLLRVVGNISSSNCWLLKH